LEAGLSLRNNEFITPQNGSVGIGNCW